jgi:hypothetical protein
MAKCGGVPGFSSYISQFFCFLDFGFPRMKMSLASAHSIGYWPGFHGRNHDFNNGFCIRNEPAIMPMHKATS